MQPQTELPQSGKRVFLNILAFVVGTIVLLLAVKYLLGL
jgi:L-asparagine transporter-like permease